MGAICTLGLLLGGAMSPGPSWAAGHRANSGILDPRVTQATINDTICRPGYTDAVAPPFDTLMARKQALLTARGIAGEAALDYALDRQVPILLGGAPDSPANLGLLQWGGANGERRKARLVVMLKRCVCEGRLSLKDAQATIRGDWSNSYPGFAQTSCNLGPESDASSFGEHDLAP